MVFSLSARQHQRQIRAGIDLVRQFGERMDRARQSGDEGARQAHFQPAGNDDDAIGSMNIKETTNISFSLSLSLNPAKSTRKMKKNLFRKLKPVQHFGPRGLVQLIPSCTSSHTHDAVVLMKYCVSPLRSRSFFQTSSTPRHFGAQMLMNDRHRYIVGSCIT